MLYERFCILNANNSRESMDIYFYVFEKDDIVKSEFI